MGRTVWINSFIRWLYQECQLWKFQEIDSYFKTIVVLLEVCQDLSEANSNKILGLGWELLLVGIWAATLLHTVWSHTCEGLPVCPHSLFGMLPTEKSAALPHERGLLYRCQPLRLHPPAPALVTPPPFCLLTHSGPCLSSRYKGTCGTSVLPSSAVVSVQVRFKGPCSGPDLRILTKLFLNGLIVLWFLYCRCERRSCGVPLACRWITGIWHETHRGSQTR